MWLFVISEENPPSFNPDPEFSRRTNMSFLPDDVSLNDKQLNLIVNVLKCNLARVPWAFISVIVKDKIFK